MSAQVNRRDSVRLCVAWSQSMQVAVSNTCQKFRALGPGAGASSMGRLAGIAVEGSRPGRHARPQGW